MKGEICMVQKIIERMENMMVNSNDMANLEKKSMEELINMKNRNEQFQKDYNQLATQKHPFINNPQVRSAMLHSIRVLQAVVFEIDSRNGKELKPVFDWSKYE